MADVYETGALTTSGLPGWLRTYYEGVLLDTIRMKSIMVPYTIKKEDFNAVNTNQIVYSEVLDLEPNWNPATETTIWKKGMHLDSRTVSIGLEWYFDVVKYTDHLPVLAYLQGGDVKGIVRNKLGQAMVDQLDILARNAHLTHPNPIFAGSKASRATLAANDYFDPDIAESIRVALEENDIPGVVGTEDDAPTIVCATTPRVCHDIRMAAGSAWQDWHMYGGNGLKKFTGEVGMWAGCRFVKTNRLRLRNAGATTLQTTLNGNTVEGQGAAATVDTIYSPGQANSTRTITVASSAGYVVGDVVTIHDHTLGTAVLETDGTQETRRIVAVPGGGVTLSFDKPLMKPHTTGNYLTKAIDVHASIFFGGPGVVWGIAERPNVYPLAKIDDANLINRIGWRGMFKFQLFRPEFYRVVESAGSTD